MNNKVLVGRFLGSEVAARARQLKKNGLVLCQIEDYCTSGTARKELGGEHWSG